MRALTLVVLTCAAALTRVAVAEPRPVTLAQALAATATAPTALADDARNGAADAAAVATGGWSATTLTLGSTARTTGLIVGLIAPLPVFGREAAARRSAQAQAGVTRATAQTARLDLKEQVEAAWLDLARARALAAVASDSAARARDLEAAAQARLDAGDVPAADVQVARAARLRAEAEADAIAADQAAASVALATALGWDPEVELVADGELPAPTSPPPLADLQPQLARHPEARAAAAVLAAAEADLALVARERRPGLALDVEYDGLVRGGVDDFRASLLIDLPLFGRGAARSTAARAQIAVAAADGRARTQQLAGALVLAHRLAAAAAARARRLADDVLPAQVSAQALAGEAYREGAADLSSALVASRELLAVQAEVIEATHAAAMARAALTRAIGGGS